MITVSAEPGCPDLTVSVISTDNLTLLEPCIASLFEATHDIALEVFLVDNASSEPLSAVIKRKFPAVRVIRNEERLGFSTNNNLTLTLSRGRYFMLLNDDTLIRDGALDTVIRFMDSEPACGAAGAYLLNPDGSFQPCYAAFPLPIIEGILPATNWTYRLGKHDELPFEVDSVCGAALVVRREVVDQIGPLDTSFDPIYTEEVEWCYRIKEAGWRVYTLPGARVIHYGSYTMNQAVPRKYELLLSHKVKFFRKHKGNLAAAAYKLTLMSTTLVKTAYWSLVHMVRPGSHTLQRRQLHRDLLARISSF